MKAAYITEYGEPEAIVYGDLPDPECGNEEVLINIKASAVNPIDTYIRAGVVQIPGTEFPYIVGADFAGVVEAVGSAVSGFSPGQHVWGTTRTPSFLQGTAAEKIVLHESLVCSAPEDIDFVDLASMAIPGFTAYMGLVDKMNVGEGDTVFIHGGSGGVGAVVIQMSKILGATVIATGGTQEKVERCLELGADHAFNYKETKTQDFVNEVAPGGVTAWFELRRQPDLVEATEALALHGRMALIAGRGGETPFPNGLFYVKCCSLFGFQMPHQNLDDRQRAAADICKWMQEGKLKSAIDRTMPLSEAAAAHRLQENSTVELTGELMGKVVLV